MHFKLLKKKNRFYEFRQTRPPRLWILFTKFSFFLIDGFPKLGCLLQSGAQNFGPSTDCSADSFGPFGLCREVGSKFTKKNPYWKTVVKTLGPLPKPRLYTKSTKNWSAFVIFFQNIDFEMQKAKKNDICHFWLWCIYQIRIDHLFWIGKQASSVLQAQIFCPVSGSGPFQTHNK